MSKLLMEALSGRFKLYASDQRSAMCWQSTKRARIECETKAKIWDDAAEEIEAVLREYNDDGANKAIEAARVINAPEVPPFG